MAILVGIFMPIATVATFMVPPAAKFQQPDLARMVFWHLPCALVSSVFLFLAPYFAFRFLRTTDIKWDIRAVAAMELGTLLGVLTLLTGMLFAKTQWGAWWNWDPRQSSYLMVMLFAAGYFALRSAFSDNEKRAANSGGYLMAALLPFFFLIFVYPRLPQVVSLHPNVIKDGSFDATYKGVFYMMLVLIGVVAAWLYQLRVRAGTLEWDFENRNAELDNRHRSATPRVVRTISLPDQGGTTS
jgi:heme exporter protein C